MPNSLSERSANFINHGLFLRVDLEVLIMAEKKVRIVGLCEEVSVPAIQHHKLQERCQVSDSCSTKR